MNIYFVRHGQTEFNANNTYQPLDSELTAKGLEQAEFVAERFKDMPIDIILSSHLKRAVQTSEIINKRHNKEVIHVEDLRECTRPSILIGKSRSDPEALEILHEMDAHTDDEVWHYDDEENFADVKSRAIAILQSISERNEDHILVVTHGEFLRLLISIILIGPILSPKEFKHMQSSLKTTNTGVTVCHIEQNKWKLLTWNDHAHLP